MNTLEQLKKFTRVVADTGDFESMRQYKPIDATTNPSLIYASARDEKYARLVDEAIDFGKKSGGNKKQQLDAILDKLAVNFGIEILKIVPGRFPPKWMQGFHLTRLPSKKHAHLISCNEAAGIDRSRILS